MSYNPYGGKYTYGGNLKHSRPFGSKNGYSTVPGYIPVGKKAAGVIVGKRPDGTPIYMYKEGSGNRQKTRTIDTKTAMQLTRNNGYKGKNVSSNTLRTGRDQRNMMRNARNNNQNAPSNTTRAASQERIDKQRKYDKSLIGRLDNATKGVRSAVGDWFNERRAELKTTGKNVGNWLSKRGEELGRFGKSAYEAISNSDERRAYEEAAANYKKDPNAANRYRMNNAKKAYDSHLLTRLGRGSKDIADTVGRTVSNAARGARDAISNQDERKAYEEAEARFRKNPTKENRKARNDAKKAYDSHLLTRLDRGAKQGARNVAKGAKDFWDYTKPFGTLDRKVIGAVKSGAEAAGKAISNQDERRAYEEAAANYKKDPNAANRYKMNNAKKAYDSHLLTRAERGVNSVADTVGNTVKNIGEYASQKSSQAAKLLSSLPSSMKSTARDMLDNIKSGKTKEDIDAALSDFMSFVSASNNTAPTSKGRKGNR